MRTISKALYIALIGLLWAQSPEEKGKALFQQRCAACHKVETKLIGPPLARIGERRSQEWFLRFVANSQALIQAGDADAVAIFKEYNQQVMPPFPDLGEEELKALWAYLNSVTPPAQAQGASATSSAGPQSFYPGEQRPMKKEDFAFLRATFWGLVGAAVGVALLLAVIIHWVSVRRASSPSQE